MANYLLLRDNKETGPFSLEDLVKLGLKPYDLVWIQGKSAAWRYPSEINELKPYAPEVEEQPFDRFYKKPVIQENAPTPVQAQQTMSVSSGEYEAYAPKVAAETQKPARKSVFVTMPGQAAQIAEKKVVAKPAPVPKPVPTPVSDHTLAETGETVSITENPVAKIKYSQPLDEIKEMYVKTLRQRKDRIARKSFLKVSLKRAALVAGLIGVGVLAGFILRSKPANSELAKQLPVTNTLAVNNDQPEASQQGQVADPPETAPALQEPAASQPIEHTSQSLVNRAANEIAASIPTKQSATDTRKQTYTRKEPAPEKEIRNPLAVMPPPETKKQESSNEEYAPSTTNPATGERNRAVRSAANNSVEKTSGQEAERPSSSANMPASPDKALSGLGDKVSVISNDYKRVALGGIRNLELTVKNHSKYDLDEVAVELQYLKPGDQVLKTQIVQFKSISANVSETVRVPDTNRGIKVQFRIVRIGSSQLVDR